MRKRSGTKASKQSVKSRTRKTSKPRRPDADPNAAAFDLVKQIVNSGEAAGKNPLAVALGRLGGLKGGRARAAKLTDEERTASAQKAAIARWNRKGER